MAIFGDNNSVVASIQEEQAKKHQEAKDNVKKRLANRATINVVAQPFPSLFEVMYSDTEELPRAINGLFRSVFVDYLGSKVEIVQGKQLYTTIFFVENTSREVGENGPWYGIERLIKKEGSSTDERIKTINSLATFGRSKIFKLSSRAEELLMDFVPNKFYNSHKGTVDWSKLTYESSAILVAGSQATPYMQVALDLNKILQALYGSKVGNTTWQYMVNVNNPIAPTSTPYGAISNKWELFITRVNSSEAQAIASKFGFLISSNNMGIITQ